MTSNIYSIDEIKQIVSPIAKKYGIEKVYLFGSYARGEARSNSDVDLLITNYQRSIPFALANILADFEETLNKPVDLVTQTAIISNARFKDFSDNILKERMILYGN